MFDRDWFKIQLKAGQKIQVDLKGSPTGSRTLSDTVIGGIYNSSGSLIANTTNDNFGSTRNSQVTFTAASTGTYYIEAKAFGTRTGTYTLGVTGLTNADEIYDTAMSFVGHAWHPTNCTGFVYTVSSHVDHPFYLANRGKLVGSGDPLQSPGYAVPISSAGQLMPEDQHDDWTAIYHQNPNGSTSWLNDIAAGDFIRGTFGGIVHSGVVAGYDEVENKLYLIDNYNNNSRIEVIAHSVGTINKYKYIDISRYRDLGRNSNDTLTGGSVNDVIGSGGGNDSIDGGGGNDKLFGNLGNDTIYGGSGNDTINGGLGFDALYGNTGNDKFVISTKSSGNTDRVYDFVRGEDKIALSKSVFGNLNSNINYSLTGSARDSNDYIVYNQSSGEIYYDPDGSGSQAQVRLMILDTKPQLTWGSDIFIA